MQRDGLFIALEGSDGTGKSTQVELLHRRLELAGYDVVFIKFPQYEQPSSYFLTQYLNGAYGTIDEVGPYTASLFFSLDRYEAARQIREALNAGNIVLVDRFTGSNMAHQGAKILHPEERRGFFIWLDNLEFRLLQIPRPDCSFVLRLPAAVAQERVGQKGKRSYTDATHDLHEADLQHLELTGTVYDEMCELFPRDFIRVDCSRDNRLLSIEHVHELLWGKIAPLLPTPQPLPAKPPVVAPKQLPFYTPDMLGGKAKKAYVSTLRALLDKQVAAQTKLSMYLETSMPNAEAAYQAQTMAELLLPVAALTSAHNETYEQQNAVDASDLQRTYSDDSEPVSLVSYLPRNELDIVPHLVYRQSNQSFRDTAQSVSKWTYDKKSVALRGALEQPKLPQAFKLLIYSWEIVSDYRTFLQFRLALPGAPYSRQALTPRLGYDMPATIEAAGLADDFEASFDASLQLFSELQTAGYAEPAEYATLLGHRVRWEVALSAYDLVALARNREPAIVDLLRAMAATLYEAHALTADVVLSLVTTKPATVTAASKPNRPAAKHTKT